MAGQASEDQEKEKEVLQQTKDYTLQLENTFCFPLQMECHILLEDSAPCSLDDIKVESLLYFSSNQGYMDFYKQTVDLLVENKVVPAGQVTHPVVSKAVSNLWQELLQDGENNIYQKCLSEARNTAVYPSSAGCTNGGKRGRAAESQEASRSFLSTNPGDVLLEDELELVASFLKCKKKRKKRKLTNPGSPVQKSSPWESAEKEKLLHRNVSDFLRSRFFSCLQCDYDAEFLRCTETFDDDDDDL